jgi:hypothetical protein
MFAHYPVRPGLAVVAFNYSVGSAAFPPAADFAFALAGAPVFCFAFACSKTAAFCLGLESSESTAFCLVRAVNELADFSLGVPLDGATTVGVVFA